MDSTRARAAPKYRRKPTGSYRLLQRDQRENAHTLRQLGTAYIEPKMNELVGQDDASPLTISDRLADLLERVWQHEFGCIGGCECKLSGCRTIASSWRRHQDHLSAAAAGKQMQLHRDYLSLKNVCSQFAVDGSSKPRTPNSCLQQRVYEQTENDCPSCQMQTLLRFLLINETMCLHVHLL